MATVELPDEQWSKILQFLRGCPDVYVSQGTDCRSFIEGVLWVARSGDCCPKSMANGTASTNGLPAGVIEASGNECNIILPMTQTWSISSLTAPWYEPTPALLEPPQKRRSRDAGSGPEPRRVQHQNPRERGCLGQSVALQADRRPEP